MRRLPAPAILLLLLGLGTLIAWWFWPQSREDVWLGYVEGESLFIAAPVSGTLSARNVERGARVAPGDALFTLNPVVSDAEVARLRAEAESARAQLADLEKQRQRPPELAVSRASIAAAQAQLAKADKDYRRFAALAAKGFVSRAQLDAAKAGLDVARANLVQTRAQVASGQLSAGRVDQLQAARAAVAAADAAVRAQQQRRSEISPASPAGGIVEQTFFNPGEWVPASTPVLSVLPDDRRKLRFFVPQERLATLKPGDRIGFGCDGCPAGLSATIRYIAPRAEFTPPVIYSEGARAKLVFMVEAALPVSAQPLPIGLPVDVVPPAHP